MTANKIDQIYDAIHALSIDGCWKFMDDFLDMLEPRVWRTDVDELVSYATATLIFKDKLKKRDKFMKTCRKFHPKKELWKGL
jgi:hypothetical protein